MNLQNSWYQSVVGKCTKMLFPITRNSKLQHGCTLFWNYFDRSSSCAAYVLLPFVLVYLTANSVSLTPLIPVLAVLFLGVLYQAQNMLLYHPNVPENSRIFVSPPPPLLPCEEVHLKTADGVALHGFFLKQSGEKCTEAPTLVYFHGNAGNAGMTSLLPLYLQCGVNILVVDYRGFGRSEGSPSERGLYIDGETAVQYLHSRADLDQKKIVLFGHSLGGGVTVHLASRSQWCKGRIAAVVLENTFTSIPDAAAHIFRSVFPPIAWFPWFCQKNHYDSLSKIGDIRVPILFIFGEKDEVVGPHMTQRLYEAAGNPRSAIVRIPDGTHNDTWCSPRYHACVAAFLNKVFDHTLANTPQLERRTSQLIWQQAVEDAYV